MTALPAIKILHIDLASEFGPIHREPSYETYRVYFLWRGVPLGSRDFRASELPVSRDRLISTFASAAAPAVRAYQAPRHASLLVSNPMQQVEPIRTAEWAPRVSVVVCTHERPDMLAGCLEALSKLSPVPREIIVVDNAPKSRATADLVAKYPQVVYVCEPRAGLDIARNHGIAASSGEIVAFTDDDARVDPGWAEQIGRPFRDPQVMASTGLVLPAELESEAQIFFEDRLGGFHRGYLPRLFDQSYFQRHRNWGVPVWDIGAGVNMALRRSALQHSGWFDERLDVGAAGCSGDSEFWYRVLASGGKCAYTPLAIVHHYHRRDLEGLKRQLRMYMKGHVASLLIQFAKTGEIGNLVSLCAGLPIHYLRLLVTGALRGLTAAERIQLRSVLGCWDGLVFYLKHRTEPAGPEVRA